ncbi:MAG: GIY-YIG nuclease family protein, partial [Rhodoplanes sp.]
MQCFWVYILASRPRGTLYVGVTNDLVRRVFEHREGMVEGFTKEHGVKRLVFYE